VDEVRFTKMEGIGNDYVYVNCFAETVENPQELAVRMSRYHFGCGSDGLILIMPSDKADFRMRMFNNDGSESEMCGNGIRCVAKYCHDRGLTGKETITIETGGGVKTLHLNVVDGVTQSVRVDMGVPELDGAKIPSMMTGSPVKDCRIRVEDTEYNFTLVNMGNPHAVTFVDDPASAPVTTHGPLLECHPMFPRKANIEFVQVIDPSHVKMRVWERGTGETLACGTGASAVLVACVLNGLTERTAEVELPGGKLQIEWNPMDNHVYMTGPATFVYDGEWLLG
jgi:diaminopimelate epimerase